MGETTKQEGRMDMEGMMAVYRSLAAPGAPHKLFESLEGSWNTMSRGWMGPDQPPAEGRGTCEQKMLLGGRYLYQDYQGTMGGEPFCGIGIQGYDNHTKKYVSVWMDTMSTGISLFEGVATTDGRTITQQSRYDGPVRGPMTWRTVTHVVDDTLVEFEMYLTPKDGPEEKAMAMTMTRMKQ